MNDKGHFLISLLKSFIIIIGCCSAFVGVKLYGDIFTGVLLVSGTMAIAEILGIVKELADKRK